MRRGLLADRPNWFIQPPTGSLRVRAQIRYQHVAAPATVQLTGDGAIRVLFDEPQSAITPGQAVVFYDEDDCLGGAWIYEAIGD